MVNDDYLHLNKYQSPYNALHNECIDTLTHTHTLPRVSADDHWTIIIMLSLYDDIWSVWLWQTFAIRPPLTLLNILLNFIDAFSMLPLC